MNSSTSSLVATLLQNNEQVDVSIRSAIDVLNEAVLTCERERTYDSARNVCKATRAIWMVIYRSALRGHIAPDNALLKEALSAMTRSITSLNSVEMPENEPERLRVVERFPHSMRLRHQLLVALVEEGLDRVDQLTEKTLSAST